MVHILFMKLLVYSSLMSSTLSTRLPQEILTIQKPKLFKWTNKSISDQPSYWAWMCGKNVEKDCSSVCWFKFCFWLLSHQPCPASLFSRYWLLYQVCPHLLENPCPAPEHQDSGRKYEVRENCLLSCYSHPPRTVMTKAAERITTARRALLAADACDGLQVQVLV